ncbi:MAG: sigma-70 family RNA polymerase sigma factor [Verrucomicrobiales bacterium]|nr:sigma-70 family RNA polymerase sigma factor [Verrucomicrobiales bacterium]
MAERNREEWKDWFDENASRLLLYARQQTRTGIDAEDVLQDAFIRMWRTAEKEPELGLPNLPFAFTSIRRCAIDLARKNQRRQHREEVAHEEKDDVQWFEYGLEDQERNAALEQAMKRLPEKYQEVLTLKIWGEQTFQSIADLHDISINTVASRYRYALQGLRRELESSPHLTS